jgi:phenylacetate-CoA ligase
MNYVMPFIRYKTNDIATLNSDNYLNSSRPLTVSKIDGRVDDMIVSENGTKIPSVNFYTVMSKVEEITMFQLYQKQNKDLLFKLVVNENFNEEVITHLNYEITKRVGDLLINFEIVDEIPRDTKTGKIRCVITEIK